MADMTGFYYPRTATGRASLLPAPPWHYSGDMLTVEYRTDPARVAELLPRPLAPAPEDPGAVALIWADWQSCGESGEELLDPVRAQYSECLAVVRCAFGGRVYSRCVYIWRQRRRRPGLARRGRPGALRVAHRGTGPARGAGDHRRLLPAGRRHLGRRQCARAARLTTTCTVHKVWSQTTWRPGLSRDDASAAGPGGGSRHGMGAGTDGDERSGRGWRGRRHPARTHPGEGKGVEHG